MSSSEPESTESIQNAQVGGVILHKESVRSQVHYYSSDEEFEEAIAMDELVEWCLLLKHKDKDGKLHEAGEIELGGNMFWLNRVAVRYKDETQKICGVHPRMVDHTIHPLPSNGCIVNIGDTAYISRVAICQGEWVEGSYLRGIEVMLSDGRSADLLNPNYAQDECRISHGIGNDEDDVASRALFDRENFICTLQAPAGQRIVAFYGHSDPNYGAFVEFGIVSAPENVELAIEAFDMERTMKHRQESAADKVLPQ